MLAAALTAFVSVLSLSSGIRPSWFLSPGLPLPSLQVLAGALLALAAVLGLAVGAGGLIAAYIPAGDRLCLGLLFVIMGLFTLVRREKEEVRNAPCGFTRPWAWFSGRAG